MECASLIGLSSRIILMISLLTFWVAIAVGGDVFRLNANTLVELLIRIKRNLFYQFSKPVADVHLQIVPLTLVTPF
jgi:hypothetical protein